MDYTNHARMELAQRLLSQREVQMNVSIANREGNYNRTLFDKKNTKLRSLLKDKERRKFELNNYVFFSRDERLFLLKSTNYRNT